MKLSILYSLLFVSLASAAPIPSDGNSWNSQLNTWSEKLRGWKDAYEKGTLKGKGANPREVYIENLRYALWNGIPIEFEAQIVAAFAQINDEDVKLDKKIANWDKWLKAGSMDRETYRKNMNWAKGKLASSNAAQVDNLEATKARVNDALKQLDSEPASNPSSGSQASSTAAPARQEIVSNPGATAAPVTQAPANGAPAAPVGGTTAAGQKITAPITSNAPVVAQTAPVAQAAPAAPAIDCSKYGPSRPHLWPAAYKEACLPK
jgi:hypothetical protein